VRPAEIGPFALASESSAWFPFFSFGSCSAGSGDRCRFSWSLVIDLESGLPVTG
jgi:hypothetical protein